MSTGVAISPVLAVPPCGRVALVTMIWMVPPFQPEPGFWWVSSSTSMLQNIAVGVQAKAVASEWSVMAVQAAPPTY
jgi:hypothetical protein